MFVVSSYTANLAAVFTTNMLESDIESVQDLFSSPKMKFGTVNGGAFNAFKVCIFITFSSKIKKMKCPEIQP